MDYQVVAINGVPQAFSHYVDTIKVPERGTVNLRLAFTDPIILGHFMLDCHVLKHEDGGIMGNIQVCEPAPPSLTSRQRDWYRHPVWWWNGVPQALCGLQDA